MAYWFDERVMRGIDAFRVLTVRVPTPKLPPGFPWREGLEQRVRERLAKLEREAPRSVPASLAEELRDAGLQQEVIPEALEQPGAPYEVGKQVMRGLPNLDKVEEAVRQYQQGNPDPLERLMAPLSDPDLEPGWQEKEEPDLEDVCLAEIKEALASLR